MEFHSVRRFGVDNEAGFRFSTHLLHSTDVRFVADGGLRVMQSKAVAE